MENMKNGLFGKRTPFVVVIAFAVVFFATEVAYGQACIGVPIPQGAYGGQAEVRFGGEVTTYGASVTANLVGPLSVGAGYGLTTSDGAGTGHAVSGRVAVEMAGLHVPACPVIGFRYSRISVSDASGALTTTSLTLPVGVAVAHAFSVSPKVTITPFVTPQLLMRVSAYGDERNGRQHALSDPDMGFGLRKGVVVGTERFFGGLGAELTSCEGSGFVYQISFGLRF